MDRRRRHTFAALAACTLMLQGAHADAAPGIPEEGEPRILSAFFGLDEEPVGLWPPRRILMRLRCGDAGAIDGMPLVVTHEIDQSTLESDGSQFEVVTRSGQRLKPRCATLAPADEENEDRTILLIGELGSHPDDPPVAVEITGSLMTEPDARGRQRDLKGLRSPPPAGLPEGPRLVLAERLAAAEEEHSAGLGDENCPEDTLQIVRVTWSGGVSQAVETRDGRFPHGAGDELGPDQYARIHVTLSLSNGGTELVSPFYIGDRDDGDNNHDLCLDRGGRPVWVEVQPHTVTDPNNDWNPYSVVHVQHNP